MTLAGLQAQYASIREDVRPAIARAPERTYYHRGSAGNVRMNRAAALEHVARRMAEIEG